MKRSDITDEEILLAVKNHWENDAPTPDIALSNKYPMKLIMAAMARAEKRGLIEYGVSLRTAWIKK